MWGGLLRTPARIPNANYIARWDGTNWQAMGSGLNDVVWVIAVEWPDVYVGGNFTNAGGNPNADHIARWDGTKWNALGRGLNGTVHAIAVEWPKVYVGGSFPIPGENPNAVILPAGGRYTAFSCP